MDGLGTMNRDEYISQMQLEMRRVLERIADAVNGAPTGNLIGGSEMAVRDAVTDFQRRAYEKALQMRVDSTESTFSPSAGRDRQADRK